MDTYMENCYDVLVSECNYTNPEFPALWIDSGDSITFENITTQETALFLPYDREELDAVTVVGENTVNGLPLLIMKDTDLEGGTITSGHGQYLLFDLTNVYLSGIGAPLSNYQMAITGCSDLVIKDIDLMAS